jgi:hypothetical protein
MTVQNALFWSFCSPYSCLLMPRLIELDRDDHVTARVR